MFQKGLFQTDKIKVDPVKKKNMILYWTKAMIAKLIIFLFRYNQLCNLALRLVNMAFEYFCFLCRVYCFLRRMFNILWIALKLRKEHSSLRECLERSRENAPSLATLVFNECWTSFGESTIMIILKSLTMNYKFI